MNRVAVERWETLLFVLLLAIVALNATESRFYLGVGNFVNLFQLSIEKSIVALMMAFVIIGGEIDLSVASVMGLVGLCDGLCVPAGRADAARDCAGARRRACWPGSTTRSGSPMSACRRWR